MSLSNSRPALTALRLGAFAGVAFLATAAVPVFAQTDLDPSTFHVGNGATGSCPTGGCPTTDPNLIGSGTEFSIFQQANGGVSPTMPLLMIFAVPHGDPFNISALNTPGTLIAPYPGGATSNVTITSTLDAYGFPGTFTQGVNFTTGDIYTFLEGFTSDSSAQNALLNANNSYSVGNMNGAESADLSLMVTSYDVYLAEAETSLNQNYLLDVTDSGLPKGTFISAFAEDSTKCPGTHCTAVDVPFTEAGLTGGNSPPDVPEPSALALLGSALAAMGFIRRRRGSERWSESS
jgi:hypothetical protein